MSVPVQVTVFWASAEWLIATAAPTMIAYLFIARFRPVTTKSIPRRLSRQRHVLSSNASIIPRIRCLAWLDGNGALEMRCRSAFSSRTRRRRRSAAERMSSPLFSFGGSTSTASSLQLPGTSLFSHASTAAFACDADRHAAARNSLRSWSLRKSSASFATVFAAR
jgi:hypothetical protein